MGRLTQFQSNFTVGEIDPLMQGRIDLEQYYSALDRAKNVLILPQGGWERRPGLAYVADLTSHLGSGITTTAGFKLIPFEFSVTQSFMIVLVKYSASAVRFFFFADGAQLTNINGSGNAYLSVNMGDIDLSKVYSTQSADTLILVHEDMAPIKLVRGANNTTWTASALSLTIPNHAFSLSTSNPSATITPDATDGTVKITASSGVFSSGNVNQYINVDNGFGRARIIEYESSTVVKTVTEIPFFEASVAIASGAWELETGYEAAWSATRGYPRTCTFHEGRLYFGGSKSMPNTLFGSKVADFFNFKVAEALDDDAILATISSDSVNAITGIRSGRDLQIFTTQAEYFVPQADLTPITPSNITIKTATSRGLQEGVKPVSADNGTIFIQTGGKAMREFMFSDSDLNYLSNNVSMFSSHLLKSPRSMALRKATNTDDGDLILVVNSTDGTMAAFSILKPQNVVAPSEFVTNGTFLEVGTDLQDIYTIVKRSLPTQATFTITVSDYANIAVGSTIVFSKHDGTEITLQFEASSGSAPSSSSGNTHYVRAYTDNNTTADNIYTAINAISGFTVANPGAAVVTVTRDDYGNDNQTVTSSDTTRLAVTQVTDGTTKYYLELFDDDRTTDAAIQYFSGAVSPDQSLPTNTTCSSLSHLERFPVDVVRDDNVITGKTVVSGAITVDQAPTTYVEVGLSYSVEVKTMPAEPRLASGSVQSRKRRIVEVTPILDNAQNLSLNGSSVPFRAVGAAAGSAVTKYTGRKRVGPFFGYSDTAQVTMTMTEPLFCTVLAVEYKLSTGA